MQSLWQILPLLSVTNAKFAGAQKWQPGAMDDTDDTSRMSMVWCFHGCFTYKWQGQSWQGLEYLELCTCSHLGNKSSQFLLAILLLIRGLIWKIHHLWTDYFMGFPIGYLNLDSIARRSPKDIVLLTSSRINLFSVNYQCSQCKTPGSTDSNRVTS